MKRILPLCILLLVAQHNFGQALNWINQMGATVNGGYVITGCIKTDLLGNTFVTGAFLKTVDFGGITLTATNTVAVEDADLFLAKYNNAGKLVWVKQAGHARYGNRRCTSGGSSLCIDDNGNVLITGTFDGRVTFPNGTTLDNPVAGYPMFTAKCDNDGNFLWAVAAGIGGQSVLNGIDVDLAGNAYITGSVTKGPLVEDTLINYSGTILHVNSSKSTFITKYSSTGVQLWIKHVKNLESSSYMGVSSGSGIKVDAVGNLYITGYYGGKVNFLGQEIITIDVSRFMDGFVAKCNTNGALIWLNTMNHTVSDGNLYSLYTTGIDLDGLGNVNIAGSFNGQTNFSGTILTTGIPSNPSSLTYDGYLAKYNSNGTLLFAKNIVQTLSGIYPTTTLNCLAADASGNTYFSTGVAPNGSTPGSFNFSGTTVTTTTYDGIISKYNNSGNLEYIKRITGPANYFSLLNGITINNSGGIYAMGTFRGSPNFFDTTLLPLITGNTDVFIFNLQPSCNGQLTPGTITNPSCSGKGSIQFTTTNIPDGVYSLTFTGNGSPKSVTINNNTFTLGELPAETYSNFYINYNNCTFSYIESIALTKSTPTSTWLGKSTNWNAPTNWSLGAVPDSCTQVIINTGVPNMPSITGINNYCKTLNVSSGAIVTVSTGAKISIGN